MLHPLIIAFSSAFLSAAPVASTIAAPIASPRAANAATRPSKKIDSQTTSIATVEIRQGKRDGLVARLPLHGHHPSRLELSSQNRRTSIKLEQMDMKPRAATVTMTLDRESSGPPPIERQKLRSTRRVVHGRRVLMSSFRNRAGHQMKVWLTLSAPTTKP